MNKYKEISLKNIFNFNQLINSLKKERLKFFIGNNKIKFSKIINKEDFLKFRKVLKKIFRV